MSKVIQVLAQMANRADLQSEQALETFLSTTEINAEQNEAIITKNVTSLERQLDICPDIVCILLPAEDDAEESDSPAEDEPENNQSIINF